MEQYIDKKPNGRRTKVSSFATKDDGKAHVEEKPTDCIYCSEDHILDKCNAFMNQTLKERIKFLFRKKIWHRCLQPMEEGHNAKSCKKRLSCITCKEGHPTPVHGYTPKNKKVIGDGNQSQNVQEEIKSTFIADVKCASALKESGSKVISMCIVPVSIKYENNDKQITTYAMLDNCSQVSFVYEAILKQLGVKGTKTTLRLKTLHGERSKNTRTIAGMQVKCINGDDNWVRRLYPRKDLPVDKEEIPTPEKITEWEHIKPITKEMVQNNVCIGLLIEANCMKALEPMQNQ